MVSLNRDALTEKVLAGDRISSDEALQLYRFPLEELGGLANARRDLAKSKSYGGGGRGIVTHILDRKNKYTKVFNVFCKFFAVYLSEKNENHCLLFLSQNEHKLNEISATSGG